MRRPTRAFVPLAAAVLLAGCSHLSLEQSISLAKAARSTAAAVVPISREEEMQIGRAVAARVAGRYGLVEDASLTEYVSLVGAVCAANSGRDELPWRFAVLAADEVNAFAAPGGYVFVTRGALKAMENEAQLAGVLSHEIAHVARKHILKEIQKANLTAAGKQLAEASGRIPAGVLDALADRGAQVLFKGYSRADEYEADSQGTGTLARAGYPADGLLSFLGRLGGRDKGTLETLFATHPDTSERLKRLAAEISSKGYPVKGRPYLDGRFRKRT